MLPRELLAVKRRKGAIEPAYASADGDDLALARELVDLFQASVGQRRESFMEVVRAREVAAGTRYKLVRGLATLLERRAAFEVAARVDPARARRALFEACARLAGGVALTTRERERAVDEAARALGVPAPALEDAFDADREGRLVLVRFDAPEPEALVKAYNVALAQTLLFDATKLTIEIGEGFRAIMGAIRREGLMYVAEQLPGGRYLVHVDGPVSLFRDTRRYGTAMAKIVPSLANARDWALEAEIHEKFAPVGGSGGGEAAQVRVRTFHATAEDLPSPRGFVEAGFDSTVERRFAEGFGAMRSNWRLVREPAPLRAGDSVLIPDFGFAWGPSSDASPKLLMEIVGFWTPGYLARKLQKLRALPKDTSLLLAVQEDLGLSPEQLEDVPGDVVFYKDEVPLVPVARWLDAHREDIEKGEAERIRSVTLPPEAPVVGGGGSRRGVLPPPTA